MFLRFKHKHRVNRVTEFLLFMFSVCLATFCSNSNFFKHDQEWWLGRYRSTLVVIMDLFFIENLLLSDFLSVFSFQFWDTKLFKAIFFKKICPFCRICCISFTPYFLGDTDKHRTEGETVSESHTVLSLDEKETDNKGLLWNKYPE